MTRKEKEKQLANARRAALMLAPFACGELPVAVLCDHAREIVADLLEQFGRLDRAEQREMADGGKGGRPRKSFEQLSPRQQRRRRKEAKEAAENPES